MPRCASIPDSHETNGVTTTANATNSVTSGPATAATGQRDPAAVDRGGKAEYNAVRARLRSNEAWARSHAGVTMVAMSQPVIKKTQMNHNVKMRVLYSSPY